MHIPNTTTNSNYIKMNTNNNADKLKGGYFNKKPMNIIPMNKIEMKSTKSTSPVNKQFLNNAKEINIANYSPTNITRANLSPQNTKIGAKFTEKVYNNIQAKILSTSPKHYNNSNNK